MPIEKLKNILINKWQGLNDFNEKQTTPHIPFLNNNVIYKCMKICTIMILTGHTIKH